MHPPAILLPPSQLTHAATTTRGAALSQNVETELQKHRRELRMATADLEHAGLGGHFAEEMTRRLSLYLKEICTGRARKPPGVRVACGLDIGRRGVVLDHSPPITTSHVRDDLTPAPRLSKNRLRLA